VELVGLSHICVSQRMVQRIIIIIGIQPLGQSGQRPELSQATGTALVRCILGRFLGVVRHCFLPRLDVPTFATRCPHVRHDARDPSGGRWNCGREYCLVILPFRDLLHAANLRHGTNGFTSPLEEGVLRIFSPLKIRRLRPSLNLRTWVLKASTLPLDHRRLKVGVGGKNYQVARRILLM
jgi:hypothetical protein